MIKHLQILLLIFGFNVPGLAQGLSFIENQGQWPQDFDYKLELGQQSVFLDNGSITVHLMEVADRHLYHQEGAAFKNPRIEDHHAFRISFKGASRDSQHEGVKKRKAYHNYILSNDPQNWKAKVPLFEEVVYRNVYPGIDLRYYISEDANFKYDLILHPGADPGQIELSYEGLDSLVLIDGDLHLGNSVMEVMETAPVAFQDINGNTVPVECAFHIAGNKLRFEFGEYVANKELVIDPQLVFSTYTGSTSNNFGYTATPSEDGGLYAGGIVFGDIGSYPVTLGAFQDSFAGGEIDISLTKFSADGSSLIYSTFLGGSRSEMPYSLYETEDKALIVMGSTGSDDFPVTVGSYDNTFNGGDSTSLFGDYVRYGLGSDMYFTILDSTGANLIGSTFFGGTKNDGFNHYLDHNYGDLFRGEIIADDNGNIFGASSTLSFDLPTSPAGFMPGYGGGQDGFVVAFDSDLSALRWATYIGGDQGDNALSTKKGLHDDLYVTGGTNSSTMIFAPDAYLSQSLGSSDGYILRLSDSDGGLLNGTYNGTVARDMNFFVDIDFKGEVYVMGQTRGVYPLKGDSLYQQPGSSQYIHKLDSNLTQSLSSTTIGDGNHNKSNISPTAFMVDDCRNVFLSGWGGITNTGVGHRQGYTHGLPTTPDAYMDSTDGSDFYFLVLDASWSKLRYASFFGGGNNDHVDGGTSRFSKDGTIYQAVCAGCQNTSMFPATPNAWSVVNGSLGCNLAAVKMQLEANQVVAEAVVDQDSFCVPYTANITDLSSNADFYQVRFPDGQLSQQNISSITINQVGRHTYYFVATDTSCGKVDSTALVLYGLQDSTYADFWVEYDSCTGDFEISTLNISQGADRFFWDFGDGATSTKVSPVHQYDTPGEYEIMLISENSYCGLSDSITRKIGIRELATTGDFRVDFDPCSDQREVLFSADVRGFQHYTWDFGDGAEESGREITHTFQPGSYTIYLNIEDTVCMRQMEKDTTLYIRGDQEPALEMPNIFTPNNDGVNDHFVATTNFDEVRIVQYHMQVYNRWGKKLFETADIKEGWDGNFENLEVPEGVYFYLMDFEDECGKSKQEKGYVHLNR